MNFRQRCVEVINIHRKVQTRFVLASHEHTGQRTLLHSLLAVTYWKSCNGEGGIVYTVMEATRYLYIYVSVSDSSFSLIYSIINQLKIQPNTNSLCCCCTEFLLLLLLSVVGSFFVIVVVVSTTRCG